MTRRLPPWALVPLAAAVWFVVGYLFWLVGGLRPVPVGPRIALPLSLSMLGPLVMGALVGGVAAGLLCLAAPRRRRAAVGTLGGVVAALAVVLVQSGTTLHGGAPSAFAGDERLVLPLCAVVVLVALAGWALGSAAVFDRAGAGLGVAALAGALPMWLGQVAFAAGAVYGGAVDAVRAVSTWGAAAVLAGALVTVGARPVTRLGWWPVLVLVAWFVGPALTAITYLQQLLHPGAGLPATLPDSLGAAAQVLWLASAPSQRPLLPWAIALVAAVVVAAARTQRPARTRDPSPTPR